MRTPRSLVLAFVLATIGLAACVAINEAVTDRDVTCEATPEDVCLRVADLAANEVSALLNANRADAVILASVKVVAADCEVLGRALTATRCWQFETTYPDGYSDIPLSEPIAPGSYQGWVYERPDGVLAMEP